MAQRTLNIRELKERRAINWSALARQIGVHPTYINHVLAGHRKFNNPKVRRALARALGVPQSQLFPPEAA